MLISLFQGINDPSGIRLALVELRQTLSTPMKRYEAVDIDAQSTSSSQAYDSSDESIGEGDLPAQIMRLVGRSELIRSFKCIVCVFETCFSYVNFLVVVYTQIVSVPPDEDCIASFMNVIERCKNKDVRPIELSFYSRYFQATPFFC